MNESENYLDNSWPDRYVAPYFTTQRGQSGDDVYERMASQVKSSQVKSSGSAGPAAGVSGS